MTLSEKCKKIRQVCCLTQRELAELVGSNQTEISFIERGFIPITGVKNQIEELYQRNYESEERI